MESVLFLTENLYIIVQYFMIERLTSCYPNVPYDYAMGHYRKPGLSENIAGKMMSGNAKRTLGID